MKTGLVPIKRYYIFTCIIKRIAQGKSPRLTHRGEVFSLRVMLIDILSGFTSNFF